MTETAIPTQAAMLAKIEAAMRSYETFVSSKPPIESDAFAAWHRAATAALAHVERLISLSKAIETLSDGERNDDIEGLLAQTRAALDAIDEDA
jgi:hypothetical protein